MNRTALIAIAAFVLAAGTARAQSTILTSIPQPNVSGVAIAVTPAASAGGNFESWAYITSVLTFNVTDSTLDCGLVTPGAGSNVPCVAGTAAPNSVATLTVNANANWSLSINDGFAYNADPGEQLRSTMTVNTPYNGTFVLKLAAANGANGGADPTSGLAEPPGVNAVVTISAAYDQSSATTDDPEKVDSYDNYGNYFGYFTVVLHEE